MNHTVVSNPICYANAISQDYLWGDGVMSLKEPLPTLFLQMASATIVNYGFASIFHHYRQPKILSGILTALVLSPSTLNKISKDLGNRIFPRKSFIILDTISNMGLLYAMFIQGLHADLTPIAHKRLKTTCLGCIAFVIPFMIGCTLYHAFRRLDTNHNENSMHNMEVVTLYWGIATAATSFPTLAPILANHRIFCTNIGQEALSIGLLNDVLTFTLVQLILALSTSSPNNYHHFSSPSTWLTIFFMFVYMVVGGVVIKPIILKLSNKVSEGENNYNSDTIAQVILFLALICGLLGNYLGSHFIFSAFVLGTSVPNGVISETMIQKMEDCVLGVLMPLYFALVGTKIDVDVLYACLKYSPVIIFGVITKTLCTLISALVCDFSFNDGFVLGVLMSTKGLLPIVIVDIGHDRGHLSKESYSLLLIILGISTSIVGPITSKCYVQTRKINDLHDQRTLQEIEQEKELRIFTCIHTPQNVYNIINLLEISNITYKPCMSIFAIHLVELFGNAPPMLVEHEPRGLSWDPTSKPFFRRIRNQSFQIIEAFHEYEDKKETFGLVQLYTMVSPIDIMHEDICNLAEDKQASLIILSFHMQQGNDCKLEDTNIEFRFVNQKVMSGAPCSVALFIDRGLRAPFSTTSSSVHNKSGRVHTHITMIYIGGPDDREALTYALRMASNPYVKLLILRFIIQDNTMAIHQSMDGHGSHNHQEQREFYAMLQQIKREKKIDDDFLNSFLRNNTRNETIYYMDKLASTGDEVISILEEMEQECDLYVIGKGQSRMSPLTASLEVWSEYRELGLLGNILLTSDFSNNSSVLVIQHYNKALISQTKCGRNNHGFANDNNDFFGVRELVNHFRI